MIRSLNTQSWPPLRVLAKQPGGYCSGETYVEIFALLQPDHPRGLLFVQERVRTDRPDHRCVFVTVQKKVQYRARAVVVKNLVRSG